MLPGEPSAQRRALAHTEAVLLVDDRDRQRPEPHVGLDQRVGAHHQRELAAPELGHDVRAPARRGGAAQQRCRDRLRAEQPLHGREMLLRERLRRRHQRRLAAVLDRAQHRCQRDHRLAAAHLSHQQALHRRVRGEVEVDLLDRSALVAGELERKRAPEPARSQARRRRRARSRRCARAAARVGAGTAAVSAAAPRRPGAGARPRARAVPREVHRCQRARPVGSPPATRTRAGTSSTTSRRASRSP